MAKIVNCLDKQQLKERLDDEISHARKTGVPLSLALFDIDRFYEFNKRLGQQAGDRLLGTLCDIMEKSCVNGGLFGRLGGDEFLAVFPKTDLETTFSTAEMIRREFSNRTGADGTYLSAGVVTYPKNGRNVDELLKSADQAVFRAKVLGGNRVCLPEDERDPLTGLYSMKSIEGLLEEEIRKAKVQGGHVSFAMLDIDDFVRVNEQLGHREGGDILMRMVAETCAQATPDGVILGRHGGDDFCIIFPTMDVETAFLQVEKLREHIASHPFELQRKDETLTVKLSFSAGVASFPQHGKNAPEIIRRADSALYKAKNTGKNRTCLPPEEKMVLKTSYYTVTELQRLSELAKKQGVSEATLLREALDALLAKYGEA